MWRLVLVILIFLVLDYYAFQSFKTLVKGNIWYVFYWILTIGVVANFFIQIFTFDRSANGIPFRFSFALILLVLFYVPKIIIGITLLGEDIFRVPLVCLFNLPQRVAI